MVKKRVEDGELVNGTGSELEILQNIEKAFYRNNKGSRQRNTQRSLKWFSQYIPRSYNRVRMAQMMRDRDMWSDTIRPGSMMLFNYDAKHKDTLPVWDRFPLVFAWDMWKGGDGQYGESGVTYFIGINLHYLPPALRFAAMKALLTKRNEKRYRSNTKLKISWSILKALSNSKYFEHSVKIYRMDHVRSKFIIIPPQSWEMVTFLPLARFEGSKSQAWSI
jgi:hypothetical protein